MTTHWIEIRGGELSPQWVLRQRVLDAFRCKAHPLTTKASVKTFLICTSHIPNGESIFLPMAMIQEHFCLHFQERGMPT